VVLGCGYVSLPPLRSWELFVLRWFRQTRSAFSSSHLAILAWRPMVQFTEYRRAIGEKGEPLFHWVGQAKLLKQPEEMTVSATPLPERFELLVIGEDGREEVRALESLELMLSKTLRPRARKPAKEAI
jgi:hypothetical protein